MLKPTDEIKLTNRGNSIVIYKVSDTKVRREFLPRETKIVPYSEIIAVSQQPGGRELLYNYLYFDNKAALEESLNVKPEIEYEFTAESIPGWINLCSVDEFKDALDFAPEGVIKLIKQFSVSLPLTDTRKIDALKAQLGFDCAAAIRNEKDTIEDEYQAVETIKNRRVKHDEQESKEAESSTRRASKYNVVSR